MAIMNLNKSNATNYQLIFPKLPVKNFYEETKEFTLNIFGTVVPSLSLTQEARDWQGATSFTDNGELTFGDWNVDFVVDSKFGNWKTIYSWIMAVNNGYDDFGYTSGKDLKIDASLFIMDNYRDKSLVLHFEDIWPISLGEVSFNKRDSEDDLVANVTFIYDLYKLDK